MSERTHEHLAAAQAGGMVDGPRRYRKKPVVVEAIQYRGTYTDEIKEFLGETPHEFVNTEGIVIATLDGPMTVAQFDWIIREPFPTDNRRHYPCKKDIFEQTYEAA